MYREDASTAEVHNRKMERNTQSSPIRKANTTAISRWNSSGVANSFNTDNKTFDAQSDSLYAVTRSSLETKALRKNHGKIVVFVRGETDEVAIARHMQNLDAILERARYFVVRFQDRGMSGRWLRNAKKKAVSEGKIIVFVREGESDETAI